MKGFLRIPSVLSLTFAFIFPSLASATGGGAGTRGGGEATSQAFVALAWTTLGQLTRRYPTPAPRIDLARLENAIKTTKVDFVDRRLELDGVEKDAINDLADRSITVNRERYARLSLRQQKKLNLHEYLRLAGENDDQYQISNPVIDALDRDPLVVLEDSTKSALLRLAALDRRTERSVCFDLAGAVSAVQQVTRNARELEERERAVVRMTASRLELWEGKPSEYCKDGRFYSPTGKIQKAKTKVLECYLLLTERELAMIEADLDGLFGRPTRGSTAVWNEYAPRFARAKCR